jgi:hypothetical protein
VTAEAGDSGLLARLARHDDEHREHDDDDGENDPDHERLPPPAVGTASGATGTCAPVPQSAPSAHTSCFQMGALAFSASIA